MCSLTVLTCGSKGLPQANPWVPNAEIRKIVSSIQTPQVKKVVIEFEEATLRELGEHAAMRKVSFTKPDAVENLLRALRVSSRKGGAEMFDGFMRPTDNVVIYLKDGHSHQFCMSTFAGSKIGDRFGPQVEALYWKYRTLAFPHRKH